MFLKAILATSVLVFAGLFYLRTEVAKEYWCAIGEPNSPAERVLDRYDLNWMTGIFEQKNDKESVMTITKQLFFPSGRYSDVKTIAPQTQIPRPQPITHHIKDAGEICFDVDREKEIIIGSMRSAGCWGSGCYDVTERKLSISTKPAGVNIAAPSETTLYASSLFVLTTNPNVVACARDCGGAGFVEKQMPLNLQDKFMQIYLGDENIGRLNLRNASTQCFRTTKGYREIMAHDPR